MEKRREGTEERGWDGIVHIAKRKKNLFLPFVEHTGPTLPKNIPSSHVSENKGEKEKNEEKNG